MEQKKRRNISAAGRRKLRETGSRNLAAYRASVVAINATAQAPEYQARLASFERDLIRDLGGTLTTAERALVDSARVSYGVVLLAYAQLSLAPGRLAKAKGLSASIAAHQNSLLRALKTLGIKRGRSAPTFENASPEERRALSRKYVESRFAETGEQKQ